MDLSEIVSIVITQQTRTPTQAGFGIPLILSHQPTWTERVREYSTFSDFAVDFPNSGSTKAEYACASKIFSQNPHPTKVFVGRADDSIPTAQFELTPNVLANYKYSFFVDIGAGWQEVTFTSDGTPTATEITAGLKSAFDLIVTSGWTSSQQSSDTVLRLLASSAGNWLNIKSADANLPIIQNHASPSGLTTALDAILVENKEWFALVTLFNSKALVDVVQGWAETNSKQYVAQTIDTVVRDTVKSGTDDVGESTQAAGAKFTSVQYSGQGTGNFLDAALLGAVLPLLPGSETWAFKELAGVTVDVLTGSQRAHLEAKNVGFYESTAGLPITWEGKEAGGQYIDITRTLEWLKARLGEAVFSVLANANKVPYTDKGIAVIEGAVRQVLRQAVGQGAIADDFVITVPKVANVSSGDKATRTLNNVTFTATLTGAVHKVNLQGTISV